MTSRAVPGISIRVRAMVIDTIALLVFMFFATYLFSLFEKVPDNAKMIAVVFIFFLYDPIFTSSFGGTLGHLMMGIRVKREMDPSRNIWFHWAILRFIVKAIVGIVSLIIVTTNKQGKAMHDYVAGSIVVFAKEPVPYHEEHNEPATDNNGQK